MTADPEIAGVVIGEDPRVTLLSETIDNLWDDEDAIPSPAEEAQACVEALDRWDEAQGVVRVNLPKQRAIEAERDRLRGVVHAMLQAFESGQTFVDGQTGTECVASIPLPVSMIQGWRLAEAGR